MFFTSSSFCLVARSIRLAAIGDVKIGCKDNYKNPTRANIYAIFLLKNDFVGVLWNNYAENRCEYAKWLIFDRCKKNSGTTLLPTDIGAAKLFRKECVTRAANGSPAVD